MSSEKYNLGREYYVPSDTTGIRPRNNGVLTGWTWTTPTLANGRLYLRGQAGTLICFDVNSDKENDGIADEWEVKYFTTTNNCSPTADNDEDGYSNFQEFVAGTDPTNPASSMEVRIAHSNGQMVVFYPSLTASGAGYEAFRRFYSMESSTNLLLAGGWLAVPNATNLLGNNTTRVYTNSSSADSLTYRVKVRLQ